MKLVAGPGIYICNECIESFYSEAEKEKAPVAANKETATGPKCSFCNRVPLLSQCLSRPSKGTICFACIDICTEIIEEEHGLHKRVKLSKDLVCGPLASRDRLQPGKSDLGLKCSFCGKSQHKVKTLIAGPGVYICNECHLLCAEILNEEHGPEFVHPDAAAAASSAPPAQFAGVVATGDVSTFEKDNFVVCQVIERCDGQYRVMVLVDGPEATLQSSVLFFPGTMVIARFQSAEEDKIVLVDYQPQGS